MERVLNSESLRKKLYYLLKHRSCLREGMQVKCETGNERWTFKIKKNETFSENSLAVEIETLPQSQGHTAFFISNVKRFTEYSTDFLFLNRLVQ